MIKVDIKTLEVKREPIPQFLDGIYGEALQDLSWTDPQLEVQDYGWWHEVNETPFFDCLTHTLDETETLIADPITKTVKVVLGIRAKTANELEAELEVQRKARVPQAIKKWRGQVVLHRRSLLEHIEMLIAQSPEMNIIYKNVTDFERNNTLIATIASVMEWDDTYIDEFFIEASQVVAG